MKIAVTAANGQLGSSILRQLKTDLGPENVVALVRSPEKAQNLGVEVRKADYDSREDFKAALKGVDRVILISGMAAPEARIAQHRNVIEGAKFNGLERIVYTSIIGDEKGTAFKPIVMSNRQTEEDVRMSGLDWSIGRNGIYLEPDLEYIDTYTKEGGIKNCAGEGLCAYTSRPELAHAYSHMLREDQHIGQTYNLVGSAISQASLAAKMNEAFGTSLSFQNMSVEAYQTERREALGDFLGTVIAGIYEGIKKGVNDVPSDFEKVVGRPHLSPLEMMQAYQADLKGS